MRAVLALLWLLAGGLAWGAGASGVRLTPELTHAHDDRAVTLGGTRPSPQASLRWETVGAEDHLSCEVPTGGGLLVSSDNNVDRSGVLAVGATYLGVCSDDAGSPLECLTARHDATDAILATGSGDIVLDPATAITYLTSKAATSAIVQVRGSTNPQLRIGEAAGPGLILSHSPEFDQFMLATAPVGGNQIVVTSWVNFTLDHGYDGTLPDPTLLVQSGDTPTTTGAGENVRIRYIAADDAGYIGTGKGPLRLNPTAASVRLPRIDAAVPAEPHVCDANGTGAMAWVNDSDDAAPAQVCVCSKTNDVPTYDWLNTTGAACAFF